MAIFEISGFPHSFRQDLSCLSCPEALQIWPPSEQTLLERDFGCTSSIATLLTKQTTYHFSFSIVQHKGIVQNGKFFHIYLPSWHSIPV